MAGFMDQQAQAPGAETPATPGPAAPAAAPEPQGQLDRGQLKTLVKRAMQILYKDRFDALVKLLRSGAQNPGQALAVAALGAIEQIQKEQPIGSRMSLALGIAIVTGLLTDLADEGLVAADQQTTQRAISTFIQMWLQRYGQTLSREDKAQIMAQAKGMGAGAPPSQQTPVAQGVQQAMQPSQPGIMP